MVLCRFRWFLKPRKSNKGFKINNRSDNYEAKNGIKKNKDFGCKTRP